MIATVTSLGDPGMSCREALFVGQIQKYIIIDVEKYYTIQ